jgi:hypothetical protein
LVIKRQVSEVTIKSVNSSHHSITLHHIFLIRYIHKPHISNVSENNC